MSEITISEEARKAAESWIGKHPHDSSRGFLEARIQLAINSATAPLQKRIEELEKHNRMLDKYKTSQIESLEKQLLAMREELTSISIALEGDVDGSPDASPRSSLATGVHRDIEALLSSPSDLSRKYVKREEIEKAFPFPEITIGNLSAICWHLKEGEGNGGITNEGLRLLLDAIMHGLRSLAQKELEK